ncbi:MAG: hypothetical protein IT371_21560 [Deltaproteobacteria bacterium]|nr:hypothetical protein [Deltaproteobacteria bacterium]
MRIPCPKCKALLEVAEELMRSGVLKTTCPTCTFAFVLRLGEAAPPKAIATEPALQRGPGLKSSGSRVSAAGEIGGGASPVVPRQTLTTVVVDPELGDVGPPIQRVTTVPVEGALRPVTTLPEDQPLLSAATMPEVETLVASPSTSAAEASPSASRPLPVTLPDLPALTEDPPELPEAVRGGAPSAAPSAPVAPTPSPTVVPAAPTPALPAAVPLPAWTLPPPQVSVAAEGSGVGRAFGLLVLLLGGSGVLFSLFVLYRNDWSLDLGNLRGMLHRALGDKPRAAPELEGLTLSPPIAREVRLAGGQRALILEGAIKNDGAVPRRYIYVRGLLRRSGLTVIRREIPAGNVFAAEQLGKLSPDGLEARLNPAGSDGRNARLTIGQSVAYMVVLAPLPEDYAPERYDVAAEIARAELCDPP